MKKPKLKTFVISIYHPPQKIKAIDEIRAIEEAFDRIDGEEPIMDIKEV